MRTGSMTSRLITPLAAGLLVVAVVMPYNLSAAGADSAVPAAWNVSPMRAGAYLEGFEVAKPTWVSDDYSLLTDTFPSMVGSTLPQRTNLWFDAGGKVLRLDTDGTIISNRLERSGGGAVPFASKPVFVDMRLRFDPVAINLNQEMLENCKLALYINPNSNLVVVCGEVATTNSTALDTDKWHQLTIKLQDNKCDVLLGDQAIFTSLSLNNAGSTNVIESLAFSGTGYVDELYVSHGDPTYAVAGPTVAVPALPNAASLSDEEQTAQNAFLQAKGAAEANLSSMTQTELNRAYLLDSLAVDDGTATVPSHAFGIAQVNLLSPTSVSITARLSVADAPKSGTINGKIQLLGKEQPGDAEFTALPGAITPTVADFTAGEATYTFTVPEGYTVFKARIVQ